MKRLSTLLLAGLFLITCASPKKLVKINPYANLPTITELNTFHEIKLTPGIGKVDSVKVIQNRGEYNLIIFEGETCNKDTFRNYLNFKSLHLDPGNSKIIYRLKDGTVFEISKKNGAYTQEYVRKEEVNQ